MKKLMIAAAIVCAAAFAQATTVTWGASNIKENGTGVSGVAYLFAATQPIGDEGASVTLTASDIIAALGGVGYEDANAWLDSLTAYQTAAKSGTMSDSSTKPLTSTMNLVDGVNNQILFAVVFDTATVTDASKFYVMEKEANVPGSGNAAFSFGTQAEPSAKAGAWNAVAAVPEPTSGLLLLLGVAGLALRRRRA